MFRDTRKSDIFSSPTTGLGYSIATDTDLFKQTLRKSLIEGNIVLVAKPDNYRRVGKTEMIVDFVSFTKDAYLIVPSSRANVYKDLLPKEKIIAVGNADYLRGFNRENIYVIDEVSFKEYKRIEEATIRANGTKPRGIVSIQEDYTVL